MNFRDTFVTCEECGKQFVFTVEKQRQMAESGREVKPPALCNDCAQRIDYGGKLHGRIKWFSLEKGYGFIVEDAGNEIFVHRSGITPTEEGTIPNLDEGQEVLYERSETPKGPQAVRVTPHYP
jgi:CspA family cold shock protein